MRTATIIRQNDAPSDFLTACNDCGEINNFGLPAPDGMGWNDCEKCGESERERRTLESIEMFDVHHAGNSWRYVRAFDPDESGKRPFRLVEAAPAPSHLPFCKCNGKRSCSRAR